MNYELWNEESCHAHQLTSGVEGGLLLNMIEQNMGGKEPNEKVIDCHRPGGIPGRMRLFFGRKPQESLW
jgi:hypothetical protein